MSELTWWKEDLPNLYKKINHEPPTVTLDASSLGWVSNMRDQNTSGNWSFNEVTYHINIKEMLVKFALNSFVKEFSNVSIKIFIDNTTVISVLKNMGTFHNLHLNSIRKQIWEWCKDRNIWLFPFYINTKKIWQINPQGLHTFKLSGYWKNAYLTVLQTLKFSPTIDLFPSRLNHQLPTYVSYKPDLNAYAVDAFSLVWEQFKFYCFPHFTECLHYRMHYRMSLKNKERRE